MTALKYDEVIKNSRELDCYFGIFWKILCNTTLMQSFIQQKVLCEISYYAKIFVFRHFFCYF